MYRAVKFDYLDEGGFFKDRLFFYREEALTIGALNLERKGIEGRFWQLCEKIAKGQNLCLYDLDYLPGQHLLRVFIMDEKTQTAVLEDCVNIDKALDSYLEEDWVPSVLTVEVSSPGLFRKLKERRHFQWSIGKRISVSITGSLETPDLKLKKQKHFVGNVLEVGEDGVKLNMKDKNFEVFIPFQQIKKAGWEPSF